MPTLTIRDLAEVAGLLAVHASHVVESDEGIAPQTLFDYTSLSRQRARHWWESLQAPEAGVETAVRQRSLITMAEDVLVSELAARVTAAVLVAQDSRHGCVSAGPFGRHVLLDQLQARHDVLSTLLDGSPPLGALLRLNRLRKRLEHWSDLLLALPGAGESAAEFACESDRWRQFRDDNPRGESLTSQQLLLVSLRLAMPATSPDDPVCAGLLSSMTQWLIALLPAHAFGRDGHLQTPWLARIRQNSCRRDCVVPEDRHGRRSDRLAR